MKRTSLEYYKFILERVSFDLVLFSKELEKAVKTLLPYELEQLKEWLVSFIIEKPELKPSLMIVNI